MTIREDYRKSFFRHTLNKLRGKKTPLLIASSLLVCFIYFRHILENFYYACLPTIQAFDLKTSIIIFSCLFLVTNAMCIPLGLPLNLLAGMCWGTWLGGLITSALATGGAVISFLIARLLKHYLVKESFITIFKLQKFTRDLDCADWQFIFSARINPLVPFSISNYLFGFVENLSIRKYIVITAVANLIPAFAIASVGSALKTFSIDDPSVRIMLSKMGGVLFLLSILIFIKWFLSKRKYLKFKGLT